MGQCNEKAADMQDLGVPSEDLILYYMPIAARGEVSRLIAHVGGLTLNFETACPDSLKQEAGSPSSLPILVHGSLKISQSVAIQSYLIRIAPKYKLLTAPQFAKDMHLCGIFEDVIVGLAKVLFDPKFKEQGADFAGPAIKEHANKWISVIEAIMPVSGFINGMPYPTAADFTMLIMRDGQTPFVGCWKLANYDPFASAPKLKGLIERTAAFPEVKEFLATSTSLKGNPFGLPS